jgi:hypothetical protein
MTKSRSQTTDYAEDDPSLPTRRERFEFIEFEFERELLAQECTASNASKVVFSWIRLPAVCSGYAPLFLSYMYSSWIEQ